MKVWPMAVPSDAELQQFATQILLWVILVAYFAYATLLRLTDTHPFMLTFPLLCAFLHLFGMLGFYLGHTLFASIWMTLVLLLDITVINLFGFVPSQGAEHYFIMVPALIFMVLPPQQREWQISLLTLTLALLSLCFVMPEPAEPWMRLTDAQFQAFKWFDLVICLLYMAVTCRFFIHRLLQQRAQLERLALTDSLTGLPNRHGLMQQLAGWYNEGHSFAVLVVEIDAFADLTHRLGQDAGDQLMRKLAQRLRTDLVQSPLIARVSERQLMLAGDAINSGPDALELAQQVRQSATRLAFDLGGRSERIQVFIGATLANQEEQPQVLLQRLAQALQQARTLSPAVQLLLADPKPNSDTPGAAVQWAPPF